MAPESNKKMRHLSGDIISNLPRDVMDNILTRLPLREAGRTSILSQRWRYMWAYLPSLVFDYDTFAGTTQKTQDQLLIAIHEILLLKRVPIVKFVLSLPGLKSCRQIEPFVSFLSRSRGFKEFTLRILKGDELYKLPASLFSCLELTYLSLQQCEIAPPIQFKGFKMLISMEIFECSILPDVLSGLISSCQLLEELKVIGQPPVMGHIQISAPNLRDLILTNGFTSISFEYTPRLSSCVLGLLYASDLTRETSNAVQFFCNLVAVEDLTIELNCFPGEPADYNSLPRKLTTCLNNLKSLTLISISFDILYEVALVLCLIRSSPNLTKIAFLELLPGGTKAADLEQITQLLEVQEWSKISLNSLREAEFHQITGKAWEIGFIKFFLAISPKLETVTVRPDRSVALQGERLEILTKLTRLRRQSPLAEIIYKY